MNTEQRSVIDHLKKEGHDINIGDEKVIAQRVIDRIDNLSLPFETGSIETVLNDDTELLNPFSGLKQYDDSDKEVDQIEGIPVVFVEEHEPIIFVGEYIPDVI